MNKLLDKSIRRTYIYYLSLELIKDNLRERAKLRNQPPLENHLLHLRIKKKNTEYNWECETITRKILVKIVMSMSTILFYKKCGFEPRNVLSSREK